MNIDLLQQFDQWNEKKKELHTKSSSNRIYFNKGDIWWCSVGLNVGSESFGKGKDFRRPILIIKKLSSDLCIALPLTSQKKEGSWFIDIPLFENINYVLLYQIRVFHKRRLQHKITELNMLDFERVTRKLELLLELSSNNHPVLTGIDGYYPKSIVSISEEEIESIMCQDCLDLSQFEACVAEYSITPDFP